MSNAVSFHSMRAARRSARRIVGFVGGFVALVALVALAVAGPVAAAPKQPAASAAPAPPAMRLPDLVRPLAYEAELTVDPTRDRFSGHVVVHVEFAQPTDFFWMNARMLDIRSVNVVAGAKTLAAKVVPGGTDFVGLRLPSTLPAGRAVITVDYDGNVDRNETAGIFRQRDGENWYAFTQFEATSARRAFPSFDEPAFKVPWHLSLVVPADDVAVSNTPAVGEEPYVAPPVAESVRRKGAAAAPQPSSKPMKRVRFAPTPPLPTYLVAFAVGPFDVVDGGRAGRKGTPLRYVVPKGRAGEVQYTKDAVPKLLELLEDYFGMPYPYEKLDSVAIPVTVGFGAMENPGLITYQQSLLVARPGDESELFKRYMVGTAAHEMAHQWFGDYVTMQWWNDIWLNESFASWMGTKITDRFAPSWDVKVTADHQRMRAFATDRLTSTKPVRLVVDTPDDLGSAFDAISYAKGAEVLSMFENAIGEERFRNGVRRYVYEHANGNARAEDFFRAIAAESGADAQAVIGGLKSFVEQPGMPRIAVALDCGADGGAPPRLVITQSRYLPSRPVGDGVADRWTFPACFQYGRGGDFNETCGLVAEQRVVMPLASGERCPQWVVPNRGGIGYFLSTLTPDLAQELVRAPLLGPEAVPVIDDVAMLAHAGDFPIDLALDLAARFANNRQNATANAATDLAQVVGHAWLADQGEREAFARYVQRVFGPRARALGWVPRPGDREGDQLARLSLLPWYADMGHDVAMQREATRLAREWMQAKTPLPLGAAPALVAAARVAQGASGRELVDAYLDAFARASPGDRRVLTSALGAFRDPVLATVVYDALFSGRFDPRAGLFVLSDGAREDEGSAEAALAWLRSHADAVFARLPQNAGDRIVRIARSTCTPAAKANLQATFGERAARFEGGARAYHQALETVDLCIVAQQTQRAALKAYLAKQQ